MKRKIVPSNRLHSNKSSEWAFKIANYISLTNSSSLQTRAEANKVNTKSESRRLS